MNDIATQHVLVSAQVVDSTPTSAPPPERPLATRGQHVSPIDGSMSVARCPYSLARSISASPHGYRSADQHQADGHRNTDQQPSKANAIDTYEPSHKADRGIEDDQAQHPEDGVSGIPFGCFRLRIMVDAEVDPDFSSAVPRPRHETPVPGTTRS